MKQIHLLSGLPGSGKSYYLDNCIKGDVFNCILHRDKCVMGSAPRAIRLNTSPVLRRKSIGFGLTNAPIS